MPLNATKLHIARMIYSKVFPLTSDLAPILSLNRGPCLPPEPILARAGVWERIAFSPIISLT